MQWGTTVEALLLFLKVAVYIVGTLAAERAVKFYRAWIVRRNNFSLLGDNWHGFHYTFKDGEPVFYETKWVIEKGFLVPFKCEMDFKSESLKYRGHLLLEGDDRVVFYGEPKGKGEEEYVVFRFPNRLRSATDIVCGLWLSYDHDRHIASGGALLTRKEISSKEAEEKIKRYVFRWPDDNLPVMRINI